MKCLDCAENRKEVKNCIFNGKDDKKCILYDYREGHNPKLSQKNRDMLKSATQLLNFKKTNE